MGVLISSQDEPLGRPVVAEPSPMGRFDDVAKPAIQSGEERAIVRPRGSEPTSPKCVSDEVMKPVVLVGIVVHASYNPVVLHTFLTLARAGDSLL